MATTKTGTRSRRVQTRKTKTSSASQPTKELRLGKNAAFYVTSQVEKEHGKRKAKTIVDKARAIAKKRQDTIIRFEHVLLAEGKVKERDFGSAKLETMRRQVQNARVPRKARVIKRKRKTTAPRSRRVRVNAGSRKGGKGSGSGRGRGRRAAARA